jgi:Flp pilus assembly protein TadG
MVEMAVLLPLVVLLLFGVIEASWAFAQANDVRHGAREGARLAAVDHGDVASIAAEVCSRMDLADGAITVKLTPDASSDGARGSRGQITVSMPYDGLTGTLDQWFTGVAFSSDIYFITELPRSSASQWWAGGSYTC